jgi:hypothetical protein
VNDAGMSDFFLSNDGIISGEEKIADIMSKSTFGFHVKPDGDGFGHLIHNWYACGRPVITNGSDYRDKLAGLLLEDGVTCIDLQKRNTQANINYIREMSKPENHMKLCQNSFKRFKEIVDFHEEEIAIKDFLDNLI